MYFYFPLFFCKISNGFSSSNNPFFNLCLFCLQTALSLALGSSNETALEVATFLDRPRITRFTSYYLHLLQVNELSSEKMYCTWVQWMKLYRISWCNLCATDVFLTFHTSPTETIVNLTVKRSNSSVRVLDWTWQRRWVTQRYHKDSTNLIRLWYNY